MKYILFSFSILMLMIVISCGNDDIELSYEDQLAKDIETINDYLDKNNIVAEEHESGIRYVTTNLGTGNSPVQSSVVNVKYEGRFFGGGIFDSNDSGISFTLSQLIPAWKIAIPLMKEGGKMTIYAPSGYCYGSTGTSGIGANKNLIFDIELVGFQ